MMKATLILTLAVLLHSKVAIGLDPTYEELQAQLPISIQPGGEDQFFFFIVPVQKIDKPNVLLQVAQAQDFEISGNMSLDATSIDTKSQSHNFYSHGDNVTLDEIFATPEDEEASAFNFEVPVIIPLDFRFRYDETSSETILPQCTVDSRTWKERVITKIAAKLELPGDQNWDHSSLTLRIRLHKDALTSITLEHFTTTEELDRFFNTIQQTKFLSDIRYNSVLANITTLTADHVSIIAEGVDTYQLIVNTLNLAKEAIDILGQDTSAQAALDVIEAQIDMLKPSADSAFALFLQAFTVVKELQAQEIMEEEEIIG